MSLAEQHVDLAIERLSALLGTRLSTAAAVRDQHGRDESWHEPQPPDAVAFAQSTNEVAEIVKICHETGTPVIAYGTGTSLEGHVQAVHGGICIDLSQMNQVLQVNAEDLDCTVQAQQLMLLGKQTQCGWRPLEDMAAAAAQVTVRLVNGEDFSDLAPQTVENGVGATVAYVPVGSYSAVGVDGVAYVIANDASITKEMVCQGEAVETTFCQ